MLDSIRTTTNGNHKRRIVTLIAAIAMAFTVLPAQAQFGIKTNLLYDATLTANIGAELRVAPKWSIDVSGNLNAWSLNDGKRWKHWLVQPEARYWFCEAMGGHFLGFHALGGEFNFGHLDLPMNILGTNFKKLKDNRYQGWMAGVGVAYGYSWLLHKHWNLEAELGVGWTYSKYDQYECAGCGRKTGNGHHNYFGLTKAAINLVYIF